MRCGGAAPVSMAYSLLLPGSMAPFSLPLGCRRTLLLTARISPVPFCAAEDRLLRGWEGVAACMPSLHMCHWLDSVLARPQVHCTNLIWSFRLWQLLTRVRVHCCDVRSELHLLGRSVQRPACNGHGAWPTWELRRAWQRPLHRHHYIHAPLLRSQRVVCAGKSLLLQAHDCNRQDNLTAKDQAGE